MHLGGEGDTAGMKGSQICWTLSATLKTSYSKPKYSFEKKKKGRIHFIERKLKAKIKEKS